MVFIKELDQPLCYYIDIEHGHLLVVSFGTRRKNRSMRQKVLIVLSCCVLVEFVRI
jgi:hypothetical protein